jgi:acyl phosphate:glycerol-3-phosphate acyltransferase
MIPAIVLVSAYLIGGIPFGYLLVKLATGRDVREFGSGNIGATNALRTSGRGIGIATLLLDILKGAAAVWLADRLTHGSVLWMSAAALAVMFGHAFSVFLKFKGGKAVASFIGAFLYLTPVPLLAVVVIFVIVVAVTRYISLGSVIGAAVFPLCVWLIEHPAWQVIVASLIAGAFIIWRHRANIGRLRAGNEHVFRFGGAK